MHTPVLLKEVLEELRVQPQGRYIDATFGEGGHSLEIAKKGGVVLGFEWDKDNYELQITNYELKQRNQEQRTKNKELIIQNSELSTQNIELVNNNFADIERIAREKGFDQVDGVLFDLGLSMEQIGQSGKGFSYKKMDELLDMRIGSDLDLTASDVLNTYDEQILKQLFIRNAEEIKSELIAREIIRQRRLNKINKVRDLVMIIESISKSYSEREAILRRIFQALRIEVNHEYKNLENGLKGATALLKQGGRLLIITFHPSEDRFVKRYMNSIAEYFEIKKPIMAKSDNAFERSAKLRVGIKRK